MQFIGIYCTFKNHQQAQEIASALVENGLAACVNILPAITSVYKWQGKTEVAQEAVFIAKTKKALFEKAKDLILQMHDYETPCIIAYDIAEGDKNFLSWIAQETN